MKKAKPIRVRARNCGGSAYAFPAHKMFPPEVFRFYVNTLPDGEPWIFGHGETRKMHKRIHVRKSRRFMNDERNFDVDD